MTDMHLITETEAAKILGMSGPQVRKLVDDGTLWHEVVWTRTVIFQCRPLTNFLTPSRSDNTPRWPNSSPYRTNWDSQSEPPPRLSISRHVNCHCSCEAEDPEILYIPCKSDYSRGPIRYGPIIVDGRIPLLNHPRHP